MNEYFIAGYGVFNEAEARQFYVPGYGLVMDSTAEAAATNVMMNII